MSFLFGQTPDAFAGFWMLLQALRVCVCFLSLAIRVDRVAVPEHLAAV